MPGFYSASARRSSLMGAPQATAAMRNDGAVARLIDTMHMGIESSIGAWESDGLIVDPGPAVTIPHVLEQLGPDFEPRAILLTHIHLDHAGGTGTLLARFPGTPVYVHEAGARHVIDPSRLWNSAIRIYGEERMLELWGETLPVPEEVVTTLRGGCLLYTSDAADE